MRLKRQCDRAAADGVRRLHQAAENRLVPEVDTIEVSQGEHRRWKAPAHPLQMAEKQHRHSATGARGARALLAESLQLLPGLFRFF